MLIEIQKAKNAVDLMRFRNYLGEQYKKQDEIDTADGKHTEALPIIIIYLLGFTLPEMESPAEKVDRKYIDLITHRTIPHKSDFIEKLTHDSYVVQLTRIHGKLHTKLEKLLSVFEQKYFVDENGLIKEYNYDIDDETIKSIVDILHFAGTDPQQKKRLEDEQEAWRVFDNAVAEGMEKALKEKDKALAENKKALEEALKTIEDLKRQARGK